MKKTINLSIILFASIVFVSCKKDHALLKKPHAMMSVSAYGGFGTTYLDTAFIIGTHDALVLHNISENADSINWNLGNGVSTNQHDVLLTYDKPGKYTVVLTAFNKDGIKSQAFKNFTVKERILKSFSINNININMKRIYSIRCSKYFSLSKKSFCFIVKNCFQIVN